MAADTTTEPKRCAKCRIVIWLITALVLATAYCLWQHIRARDALNRWKSQMVSQGDSFDLAELAPPPHFPPTELTALEQTTKNLTNVLYLEPMDYFAPGQSHIVWAADVIHPDYQHPDKTAKWEELNEQLVQASDVLKQIRETVNHPLPTSGRDYGDVWAKVNFIAHRTAAQKLSAALLNDLHHHQLDAALENLTAIAALSRWNQDEPSLVCQMIRTAIMGLGVSDTWEALQAPGWNEDQLHRLQTAWESSAVLPELADALDFDRAASLHTWQVARHSLRDYEKRDYELKRNWDSKAVAPQGSFFKYSVAVPLWNFTQADRYELAFLQAFQPYQEKMREAIDALQAEPVFSPVLSGGEPVDLIAFDGTTLQDTIQFLAKQCQLKVVFDPSIRKQIAGIPISLRWAKISAEQALAALLQNYQLVPDTKVPGTVRIRKGRLSLPANTGWIEADINTVVTNQESLDLVQFDRTDLDEALRTLARQAGINITIDPQIMKACPEPIICRYTNQTLGTVLKNILNEHHLTLFYNPTAKIARIIPMFSVPQTRPWFKQKQDLENEFARFEGRLEILCPDKSQPYLMPEVANFQRAIDVSLKNETFREMAITVIALRRYEMGQGHKATNLLALVPGYLPRLPHDYLSGNLLIYRLNPDETFLLYSVGENGEDDHGDASYRADKPNWTDLWAGRDAVWPTGVK